MPLEPEPSPGPGCSECVTQRVLQCHPGPPPASGIPGQALSPVGEGSSTALVFLRSALRYVCLRPRSGAPADYSGRRSCCVVPFSCGASRKPPWAGGIGNSGRSPVHDASCPYDNRPRVTWYIRLSCFLLQWGRLVSPASPGLIFLQGGGPAPRCNVPCHRTPP